MRMNSLQINKGYILMDALLAIFLFAFGFFTLYALTEEAVFETQQAVNLTEAVNKAQSCLDNLISHPWDENFELGRCIPGEVVEDNLGLFNCKVSSEWMGTTELLRVNVEINWVERGRVKSYKLGSIAYVQSY